MKKELDIKIEKPQFVGVTGITYAQVDQWFGHCRLDLKLDLIYPEDHSNKKYPCIVWVCGGAWITMNKSAHLAYLSKLAMEGFVVASVEYRTSNEAQMPAQLEDVKAAIRYLKAHADRFRINAKKFGIMGESAGGYLSAFAALCTSKKFEKGDYLEYSSSVQAACPWYPPVDIKTFPRPKDCETSPMENLLLGFDPDRHPKEASVYNPIDYVTKKAPPFLIIHGDNDHTVPYGQGVELHDVLEAKGCDVTLLTLKGADHADIRFFQDKIWDEIGQFFKDKLAK